MSIPDVRSRVIPRILSAAGILLQCVSFIVEWIVIPTSRVHSMILTALLICFVCTVVQLFLTLVKPGSLGMGDVTATVLLTLGIGRFGWTCALLLWLFSGLLGLLGLLILNIINKVYKEKGASRSKSSQSLPFAPFLTIAAFLAILAIGSSQIP